MKRHTLKRFPARIQQMAQDIEALNADPVLGPLDVLLPGDKQTQGVGRNLVEEIRDRTTRERKQLARRNISEFHFRSGRSDTPTSL